MNGMPARFWSKVRVLGPGQCWPWCASLDSSGYGHFWLGGRLRPAHRVALELWIGPLPDDVKACHNCPGGDYRACCNPRHLFPGTHEENMVDMARKGRGRKGSLPYGVYRDGSRFGSQTHYGGRLHYVGIFDTAEQAHSAAVARRDQAHASRLAHVVSGNAAEVKARWAELAAREVQE